MRKTNLDFIPEFRRMATFLICMRQAGLRLSGGMRAIPVFLITLRRKLIYQGRKREKTKMSLPQKKEYYTYADYCSWDDGKRWELIEGVPHAMSPAPTTKHQSVSSNLHGQFFNFLSGKPCKVFHAPFDVRLNAHDNDDTVVQPDLTVICDRSKLDDKGCKGAPDLVVEISSPSTARLDRVVKFNQYLKAGVTEYWIIDLDAKTLQVCILENGRYFTTVYADTDTALVKVLNGCIINLAEVFAE